MKPLLLVAIAATAMTTPTRTSELDSLRHATEWINSPPLTAEGLRGKVVLVQFWTYSCVNWIRTLPYARAWAEKYRDQELVVIGVHSPEFGFEHQLANVRRASGSLRVGYPVAMDNDFAIWRAFDNQYWPALYLIDGKGRIRYRHFGEGDYEHSERAIQDLLAEAGARDVGEDLVSVTAPGAETAADWNNLKSPETYLGTARSENRISWDARLRRNEWALKGRWTVGKQSAVLEEANGWIAYRFHARDLNLVMTPGSRGSAVRFRVLIDGHPPGSAHGIDVDQEGNGTVDEPRMYQLIRQSGTIVDRQFEIQFLDPGVAAFVFTFG
jgi:thiol-disulfide isomerase/thioredoxin